MMHGQKKH